jgi:hypothetical protein
MTPESDSQRFQCPCCEYWPLGSRGHYAICPVCGWEDDPAVDWQGADVVSGPNRVSLRQARDSYAEYGAATVEDRKRVRGPLPGEMRRSR